MEEERQYMMDRKYDYLRRMRYNLNPNFVYTTVLTLDKEILDIMTIDELKEIYEMTKKDPDVSEKFVKKLAGRTLERIFGKDAPNIQ